MQSLAASIALPARGSDVHSAVGLLADGKKDVSRFAYESRLIQDSARFMRDRIE